MSDVTAGARTPEELETLLEDALVVGDGEAIGELFEAAAVLVGGCTEARGREAIVQTASGIQRYTADTQRVIQAGKMALLVGTSAIGVAHRGPDQRWRFSVVVLREEGTLA